MISQHQLHCLIQVLRVFDIGGNLLYSDIRDQQYRTELDIGTSDIRLNRVESDIISDIGIKFYLISDI